MTSEPPIRFEADLPRLTLRRRTLPCGLEVVIHPDHAAPQVTTSVTYRVGSSDETPAHTGFAHLFEHLFKSSAERLGGHHYDVLRRAGASEANASTSADRTAYHETLPANQLGLALWIESDRMGYFLPDFEAQRLTTQQSVVRAERRQRYEDVPYGSARFAVACALWPEGHPLRHMTIGLHADI
ncbi:MAG: insulinase family protein, partial [Deltaproteobacteria bacterium]|nr:insulinase family protein [Deltaproteobacteria bacterium]